MLILSIVSLELVFFAARVGESDHLMPDRLMGFKPMAGKRITQRKEGFSSLTINHWGMQNDPVQEAKATGVLRVAVFGDSFVEALQVPRPENYCSLLEKDLSAKLQRPVQVLNFGVSNYSVAQDYLRYKTLARRFNPDIVVLAYRVGETEKVLPNTQQGLAFVRPVYFPAPAADKGQGGPLSPPKEPMVLSDAAIKEFQHSKEYKRLMATQWLRANSRIWGIWGQLNATWQSFMQKQSLSQTTAPSLKPQLVVSSDENRQAFAKCYWYMVSGVLEMFGRDVSHDGARLIIMHTPFKIEGHPETLKNPAEAALLRNTARNIKAAFLDLDGELQAQGVDKHPEYFLEFGHFSRPLHRLTAARLSEFISTGR